MSKIGDCPCLFKDQRCRYVGAEMWCDKTFERCRALDNVINFRGGYPQPIPALVDVAAEEAERRSRVASGLDHPLAPWPKS